MKWKFVDKVDTWALSESMHMWQREAQKKYSFALYFSKELSKAEAATFEKKIEQENENYSTNLKSL